MFIVQGGFERSTEALLQQLAADVVDNEGTKQSAVYAETADEISAILVRAGARARVRRAAQPTAHGRNDAEQAAAAVMAALTSADEDALDDLATRSLPRARQRQRRQTSPCRRQGVEAALAANTERPLPHKR